MERAGAGAAGLKEGRGRKTADNLSALGWEHINLTDDYTWRQSKQVEEGRKVSATSDARRARSARFCPFREPSL